MDNAKITFPLTRHTFLITYISSSTSYNSNQDKIVSLSDALSAWGIPLDADAHNQNRLFKPDHRYEAEKKLNSEFEYFYNQLCFLPLNEFTNCLVVLKSFIGHKDASPYLYISNLEHIASYCGKKPIKRSSHITSIKKYNYSIADYLTVMYKS